MLGVKDVHAYLSTFIADAVKNHQFDISPVTQYYLASMLNRFVRSENLFQRTSLDSPRFLEPITFRYLQMENTTEMQNLQLQRLADECLFLVGFCYEFIEKEGAAAVNYHCNVGSSAYQRYGTRVKQMYPVGTVYEELAARFRDLSTVIWDLRLQQKYTPQQIRDVYLKYEHNPDFRYSAVLIAQGILPNSKKIQS